MIEKQTNFRLAMKCKDLILFFGDFVGKKGKENLGPRMRKFLQSSNWGKEGNCFDALD